MPEESSPALTLSDVQRARQRIAPCVRRTPLIPSVTLSERLKTNVYVKLEMFQKTGSFKVRGAFNKALSLATEKPTQGPGHRQRRQSRAGGGLRRASTGLEIADPDARRIRRAITWKPREATARK